MPVIVGARSLIVSLEAAGSGARAVRRGAPPLGLRTP